MASFGIRSLLEYSDPDPDQTSVTDPDTIHEGHEQCPLSPVTQMANPTGPSASAHEGVPDEVSLSTPRAAAGEDTNASHARWSSTSDEFALPPESGMDRRVRTSSSPSTSLYPPVPPSQAGSRGKVVPDAEASPGGRDHTRHVSIPASELTPNIQANPKKCRGCGTQFRVIALVRPSSCICCGLSFCAECVTSAKHAVFPDQPITKNGKICVNCSDHWKNGYSVCIRRYLQILACECAPVDGSSSGIPERIVAAMVSLADAVEYASWCGALFSNHVAALPRDDQDRPIAKTNSDMVKLRRLGQRAIEAMKAIDEHGGLPVILKLTSTVLALGLPSETSLSASTLESLKFAASCQVSPLDYDVLGSALPVFFPEANPQVFTTLPSSKTLDASAVPRLQLGSSSSTSVFPQNSPRLHLPVAAYRALCEDPVASIVGIQLCACRITHGMLELCRDSNNLLKAGSTAAARWSEQAAVHSLLKAELPAALRAFQNGIRTLKVDPSTRASRCAGPGVLTRPQPSAPPPSPVAAKSAQHQESRSELSAVAPAEPSQQRNEAQQVADLLCYRTITSILAFCSNMGQSTTAFATQTPVHRPRLLWDALMRSLHGFVFGKIDESSKQALRLLHDMLKQNTLSSVVSILPRYLSSLGGATDSAACTANYLSTSLQLLVPLPLVAEKDKLAPAARAFDAVFLVSLRELLSPQSNKGILGDLSAVKLFSEVFSSYLPEGMASSPCLSRVRLAAACMLDGFQALTLASTCIPATRPAGDGPMDSPPVDSALPDSMRVQLSEAMQQALVKLVQSPPVSGYDAGIRDSMLCTVISMLCDSAQTSNVEWQLSGYLKLLRLIATLPSCNDAVLEWSCWPSLLRLFAEQWAYALGNAYDPARAWSTCTVLSDTIAVLLTSARSGADSRSATGIPSQTKFVCMSLYTDCLYICWSNLRQFVESPTTEVLAEALSGVSSFVNTSAQILRHLKKILERPDGTTSSFFTATDTPFKLGRLSLDCCYISRGLTHDSNSTSSASEKASRMGIMVGPRVNFLLDDLRGCLAQFIEMQPDEVTATGALQKMACVILEGLTDLAKNEASALQFIGPRALEAYTRLLCLTAARSDRLLVPWLHTDPVRILHQCSGLHHLLCRSSDKVPLVRASSLQEGTCANLVRACSMLIRAAVRKGTARKELFSRSLTHAERNGAYASLRQLADDIKHIACGPGNKPKPLRPSPHELSCLELLLHLGCAQVAANNTTDGNDVAAFVCHITVIIREMLVNGILTNNAEPWWAESALTSDLWWVTASESLIQAYTSLSANSSSSGPAPGHRDPLIEMEKLVAALALLDQVYKDSAISSTTLKQENQTPPVLMVPTEEKGANSNWVWKACDDQTCLPLLAGAMVEIRRLFETSAPGQPAHLLVQVGAVTYQALETLVRELRVSRPVASLRTLPRHYLGACEHLVRLVHESLPRTLLPLDLEQNADKEGSARVRRASWGGNHEPSSISPIVKAIESAGASVCFVRLLLTKHEMPQLEGEIIGNLVGCCCRLLQSMPTFVPISLLQTVQQNALLMLAFLLDEPESGKEIGLLVQRLPNAETIIKHFVDVSNNIFSEVTPSAFLTEDENRRVPGLYPRMLSSVVGSLTEHRCVTPTVHIAGWLPLLFVRAADAAQQITSVACEEAENLEVAYALEDQALRCIRTLYNAASSSKDFRAAIVNSFTSALRQGQESRVSEQSVIPQPSKTVQSMFRRYIYQGGSVRDEIVADFLWLVSLVLDHEHGTLAVLLRDLLGLCDINNCQSTQMLFAAVRQLDAVFGRPLFCIACQLTLGMKSYFDGLTPRAVTLRPEESGRTSEAEADGTAEIFTCTLEFLAELLTEDVSTSEESPEQNIPAVAWGLSLLFGILNGGRGTTPIGEKLAQEALTLAFRVIHWAEKCDKGSQVMLWRLGFAVALQVVDRLDGSTDQLASTHPAELESPSEPARDDVVALQGQQSPTSASSRSAPRHCRGDDIAGPHVEQIIVVLEHIFSRSQETQALESKSKSAQSLIPTPSKPDGGKPPQAPKPVQPAINSRRPSNTAYSELPIACLLDSYKFGPSASANALPMAPPSSPAPSAYRGPSPVANPQTTPGSASASSVDKGTNVEAAEWAELLVSVLRFIDWMFTQEQVSPRIPGIESPAVETLLHQLLDLYSREVMKRKLAACSEIVHFGKWMVERVMLYLLKKSTAPQPGLPQSFLSALALQQEHVERAQDAPIPFDQLIWLAQASLCYKLLKQ